MWLKVNIVVLAAVCVPFITSAVPNYQTSTKQNWTTAQEGCSLIGQSVFCDANGICSATTNGIQGNGSVIDAWVGAYYKKSPWITHLGCYSSSSTTLNVLVKITDNSVKNCYKRCKDEMKNQLQIFALQLHGAEYKQVPFVIILEISTKNRVAALRVNAMKQEEYCYCKFVKDHEGRGVTCINKCRNTDDYCGSNVNKMISSVSVSLYKVSPESEVDNEVLNNKNCKKIQDSVVVAENCTALHGVICKNGGDITNYTVRDELVTWEEARSLCRSVDNGRLIYGSEFNNTDGNSTKSYWLDEFRIDIVRWINDSSEAELSITPKECVGLSLTGNKANFIREDCTQKKAALCFGQGEHEDDILTSVDYSTATGISDIVSITTEPIIRWTSEKTDAELATESSTPTTKLEFTPPLSQEDASDSNQVFVYVGAGVAFIAVVCIVAIVLIIRKRKSSKKSLRGNDDANVEDAGVIEGQALLLNDSPTNNQNSPEGNTDAYSVVVSTKGFDYNNKETEIGDYNEIDTENNEYHHLRFKGSKRYSVDENDDTYDHTTALLEDELYSKTSTACKAKDEFPDPTYDHALQRDSTYDHCVPRSEKGTESYPNNQEVDYPYDKCQNVVRQNNTGPADDPCQPAGNMVNAVQSDADPCQQAGNVHDALQSDDDPHQPADNVDDAVQSDDDPHQPADNVDDAVQSDDDPRQPAGDVDDTVQSDKPSQPDTIPVEDVIPSTDGI